MPRRSRCLLPGVACHITQRGVDRRETFSCEADRTTYLTQLRENLAGAQVRILGWCLMTNHIHLVAVPEREDSLSVLLRRVHGRYAQYYNARAGRSGHLWQSRYFACVLEVDHLRAALAYVERNPVRSGMVERAADYRWSSAAVHLSGADDFALLDMEWWREWRERRALDWARVLGREEETQIAALRESTYSGKPYGSDAFLQEMSERFGRHWVRGRPRNDGQPSTPRGPHPDQAELF